MEKLTYYFELAVSLWKWLALCGALVLMAYYGSKKTGTGNKVTQTGTGNYCRINGSGNTVIQKNGETIKRK